MIAVGIKSLKNKLSQYLKMVKEGETVVITEHNRIIAEIHSYTQGGQAQKADAVLTKLAAEGSLIKAKRQESKIDSLFLTIPEDDTLAAADWKEVYSKGREDRYPL